MKTDDCVGLVQYTHLVAESGILRINQGEKCTVSVNYKTLIMHRQCLSAQQCHDPNVMTFPHFYEYAASVLNTANAHSIERVRPNCRRVVETGLKFTVLVVIVLLLVAVYGASPAVRLHMSAAPGGGDKSPSHY